MAYTTDDVGPRLVNGELVELSAAEKQALVDAWDAAAQETPPYWVDRRGLYHTRTVQAKGVEDADRVDSLGFWMDAIAGVLEQEIEAGRLQPTAEITALLAIRSSVKTDIPKPE